MELGGSGVIGGAREIDQVIGEGVGSVVAVERAESVEDVGEPAVETSPEHEVALVADGR